MPEERTIPIHKRQTKNWDLFAANGKDFRQDRYGENAYQHIRTRAYKKKKKKKNISHNPHTNLGEEALDKKLVAGILDTSGSTWNFPVVFVEKKFGTKRFCVDFRALNKIAKSNAHTLPFTDYNLTFLISARYFSKLDIKSGQ